jgi:speckle-type POZ protein
LAFAGADSGRHRRQFQDTKYREQHIQQRPFLVIPVDAVLGRRCSSVVVPPSDILQHFSNLLLTKEGADVTFEAGCETFVAHRCVLAARSAVFRAELFGPMKEGSTTSGVIKVDDMEAPVFEAVLKFIYTDSLPPEMEKDRCDQDVTTMWQHLLVAADRYDLLRLRLMCE